MGTIVPRGKTFRAVVRLGGTKPQTKTFPTERDAKIWITQIEAKITLAPRVRRGNTLGFAFEKARLRELAKPFKSDNADIYLRFHKQIGHMDLADCSADWWQETMTGWTVAPYTRLTNIRRIKAALRVAEATTRGMVVDWDAIRIACARLSLPGVGLLKKGRPRTRRASSAELAAVKAAAAAYRGKIPFADVVDFAVATCMREAEIFRLTWDDLNKDAKGRPMQWIRDRKDPKEKMGNDQNIPLLGDAYKIAKRQPRRKLEDGSLDPRIFPYHVDTFGALFTRFARAAKIKNLHFHDLRHEGISRLFEQSYSIPEVCEVSGHKDWNVLRSYLHLGTSLHDGPLAHRRAA
jgi:integrase